uniref:Vesicle-associated membrane protein-associated protein B n=1 Tax=Drosophila rhopaloa TaxID=1041015 RepID=A0A6P4ETC0_DRORH
MDLLSVSPQRLTFYAPYDRSQRRMLTLLNPNNRKVLFKIKSNVWRYYHVSPNAGMIEPYCFIEIRISLNYFDFHEDLDQHHRFCIQSTYAPRDQVNGETTLAIFRRVSSRDISSKSLHVRLEATPLSLASCGLDLQSPLGKMVLERDLLKPLCPKCPDFLNAPLELEKAKANRHISKLVIIGSLLIAYMQRKQMHEVLINNFYPDKLEP